MLKCPTHIESLMVNVNVINGHHNHHRPITTSLNPKEASVMLFHFLSIKVA